MKIPYMVCLTRTKKFILYQITLRISKTHISCQLLESASERFLRRFDIVVSSFSAFQYSRSIAVTSTFSE